VTAVVPAAVDLGWAQKYLAAGRWDDCFPSCSVITCDSGRGDLSAREPRCSDAVQRRGAATRQLRGRVWARAAMKPTEHPGRTGSGTARGGAAGGRLLIYALSLGPGWPPNPGGLYQLGRQRKGGTNDSRTTVGSVAHTA
jgi:hypothetical protein